MAPPIDQHYSASSVIFSSSRLSHSLASFALLVYYRRSYKFERTVRLYLQNHSDILELIEHAPLQNLYRNPHPHLGKPRSTDLVASLSGKFLPSHITLSYRGSQHV
ncbi:hypothetical protein EYR40_008598 [Pleurotus pulmonarius]|nr:hypothetical protein EYR36_009417 [Pleurotus pulmonarius]KAF4593804.1 hypothetical protein EYR40_008598 [Pleurotus pulmonarius]